MSTYKKLLVMMVILILFSACGSIETTTLPLQPTSTRTPTPNIQIVQAITVQAPTNSPQLDYENGVIAFTSERDGNMEIYTMSVDGSGLQRLTNQHAEDYWPTWSPDGAQIAFASNRDGDFEIYVVNADGSDLNRLTLENGNDLEPDWSPDGSKIAFMVNRSGKSDIYTMRSDGSQRQRLTDTQGDHYLPKWSPDGAQIVYVSERDGNPEIYVMNADGSQKRRLTDNPSDDRYPSWSADGTRISFYSDRDGNQELYLIDLEGSSPYALTDDDATVWVSDWSPDGGQIVFTSNRDGNRELYIIDSDGSNMQRLTNNNVLDGIPAWRPIVADTSLTSTESVNPARDLLTYDDLFNGFESTSPVDESALSIPPDAAPPAHVFEGRLELHGEDSTGQMTVLRGDMDQEPEVSHLPEFDFEFVQNDEYLIPVQRGLIIADHSYWNYILEPGRVWMEDGDQYYSRASFPFALVRKGSNATFNGTMTFLFDDVGISKVWYQVTQETAVSTSLDLWGLLDGGYHPGRVKDSDKIKNAFARELADRFPTKPIELLLDDFPGVDVGAFGRGIDPSNMTWYGFVADGINYVGGCQTRYGTYPYCEFMRAPSYSTAKSAFVSVAMMRLAQKYDPGLPNLLIKDYVPEAAESSGDWSTVTFDLVLDMTTGNYESAGMMVDEEQWDNPFWTGDYFDEIIAAAFDWPHSAEPGTQWVYRTSDTIIVTHALQNYLDTMEGPDADIFDFVVDEVYAPLNMSPGVFSVLRTKDNNWQGKPYGGVGLWWVPDDLAKISSFLNADGGMIDGQQILYPELLAAALQHDPADRGVVRGGYGQYNNAFWADSYRAGYDCEFWVPQMLGYSGIVVLLMPNGTTYYYASDGRNFTWDSAVREADNISPHCP